MLYTDTCVLLAVLTPEAHSALGLKVRTRALSQAQAEADFRNANACLRGWSTTLRWTGFSGQPRSLTSKAGHRP